MLDLTQTKADYCLVPHDMRPRRLLVGEGLRSTKTGLVAVQQVSNRRAGRAVFTWVVMGEHGDTFNRVVLGFGCLWLFVIITQCVCRSDVFKIRYPKGHCCAAAAPSPS